MSATRQAPFLPLLIVVTAVAFVVPSPDPTHAQIIERPVTEFSLTLVSDPTDVIGQGGTYLFEDHDKQRSKMFSRGNKAHIDLRGGANWGFWLQFVAPKGQRLHPGFYAEAETIAFRRPGHAGIYISINKGCPYPVGWFDIKYVSFRRDGSIRRLWISFEQHCEGNIDGLYGDLRIGPGARSNDAVVVPDKLLWPDVELGASSWALPVYVVPHRPGLHVQSIIQEGLHVQDFPIQENTCPGQTLAPGTGCGLVLRFVPTAGGPRISRLIARVGNVTRSVALESMGIPGRSSLTMSSQGTNDHVGLGKSWAFSQLTGDRFWVWRSPGYGVHVWIDTHEGSVWLLDFIAPGDLQEGVTYENVKRYGFSEGGPGMSVSGESRGCNEISGRFTVHRFGSRPNGLGDYFSISFEQHCDHAEQALTGLLEYRVPIGETEVPGPVTNLRVRRFGTRARVTWDAPSDLDVAAYVLRWTVGRNPPGGPLGGYAGYSGTGRSAMVTGLNLVRAASISVYAVDTAGNIGNPISKISPPKRR